MRKLRGGRGTFTPLQGRSPDLKFVGAKIFDVFFLKLRKLTGEGVRSHPLRGRSPDLKFVGAKIF